MSNNESPIEFFDVARAAYEAHNLIIVNGSKQRAVWITDEISVKIGKKCNTESGQRARL